MKKNVLPILLFLVLLLSSCSSVDNKETSPNDQKSTSLTSQTTDPINSNQGGGQSGGQGGGQGANTSNTPFIPPQTSTSDGHTHNFVMEHLNEQSATCTQGGYYLLVYKCSICQQIFAQQDVNTPALGHNFVEYNREDATYEHATKIYERCSRCEQENIRYSGSPLMHNYNHEYSYDDSYHWHQCVDAGYEELYEHKIEHVWDYENRVYHVVSETEDGYTETPCHECGYVRITDYEPAYNKRTYHWCGEYPNDWRHYYTWLDENNELKTSEIQYCHWTETGRQNPDYDVDGYYTDVCDECHHEYTQILPGYEHNWSIGWNETQHYEYCTDEGYHELKRNFEDHIFDIVEQHRSTDANPKYIDGSTYGLSNNSQDWNLVVCSVCGCEQKIDLHHYSDSLSFNASNHFYACTDPGYENLYKNSEYHYYSSGYYHTTGEATFEHAAYDYYSCTCGYEHYDYHGETLPHNYSDELSFDETSHWYSCIDDGYETLKIGEEAHTMSNWEITANPSRDMDGVEERHCLDCEYTESRNIDSYEKYSLKNLTFTYQIETNSYSVRASSTTLEGEIYIPNTYEGLAVSQIDEEGFKNCSSITHIGIPDSIYEIPDYAFANCSSLSVIEFGNNVKKIGNYSFSSCTGLTELHLPDCVEELGDFAFQNCTNLPYKYIYVGTGLWKVGHGAFDNCKAEFESYNVHTSANGVVLFGFNEVGYNNTVTIPESTRIVVSCHAGYGTIETISGGQNVTTICKNAFNGLSISSINFSNVRYIGESAFENCSKFGKTEPYISYLNISLPNVEYIGKSAFKNCSSLKYVSAGSDLSYLGEEAFYQDQLLESASGLMNVCAIPDNCFYGCNLKTINIGDNVTSIGAFAFKNNNELREIHFGLGITEIPSNNFEDLTKLTTITGCENVEIICENAFRNCTALSSFPFTDKLMTIESRAFESTALISINLEESTTSIGDGAFSSCSSLASISIKGSCAIGDSAFLSCTILNTISIPNVISIGNSAFNGCSFEILYLPDSLISVGEYAFANNTSIYSLHFNHDIQTVGQQIFKNCTALKYVYYDGTYNEWVSIDNGSNYFWRVNSSINRIICTDQTHYY